MKLYDRHEIEKLNPFFTQSTLRYYMRDLKIFSQPCTRLGQKPVWTLKEIKESFKRVEIYKKNKPPTNNKKNRALKRLVKKDTAYDIANKAFNLVVKK
jgi:hypothetical protein